MFKDNLSKALLNLIEEKKLTQEKLAEVSNLSTRYVNKIIGRKAKPSLESLEKICVGLEITPNELLLPANFKDSVIKEVTKTAPNAINGTVKYKPVCPHCGKLLESENMFCCSYCFGKLSWKNFYTRSGAITQSISPKKILKREK